MSIDLFRDALAKSMLLNKELANKCPWMAFAMAELGVAEGKGTENNPRVVEYLKLVGFSNDETPWCAGFANWCMNRAGIVGTGKAGAKWWITWGKALATPEFGAITVFTRPPDPASGHVAFFISEEGENIIVLGGNQSKAGTDGAVTIGAYPKSRLLGYRWKGSSS